ncbi:MAG: hypothetical protein WCJ64_10710 [Rhodospirillaceae bacterium]
MQRNVATLSRPATMVLDSRVALEPVSDRVAELLRPTRTVPRCGDHGFEGVTEVWEPRPVSPADVPDLERQLALIEQLMEPGEPGVVLARIHALLSHYRDHIPLPPQVEAAIAEDWLDDLGDYPAAVVVEACRRWRRDPKRYRFKPLPGDIRALCAEVLGQAPVTANRLRRLLTSVRIERQATLPGRAADVRSRVAALAAAKRVA